eukprot:scaffold4971_cov227-Skeletonema_marinoi.AAC.1
MITRDLRTFNLCPMLDAQYSFMSSICASFNALSFPLSHMPDHSILFAPSEIKAPFLFRRRLLSACIILYRRVIAVSLAEEALALSKQCLVLHIDSLVHHGRTSTINLEKLASTLAAWDLGSSGITFQEETRSTATVPSNTPLFILHTQLGIT